MKMKMEIGYLYDKFHKEKLNRQGKNYWFEYLKEILCQLGVSAKEVSPKALSSSEEEIKDIKILFIGSQDIQGYGIEAVRNVDNWVAKGGILIGFKTEGLDNIFGNTDQSEMRQRDDFSLSGYFDFKKHKLTQGIHSFVCPSQKLLIFSDIRAVITKQSEPLVGLYTKKDGQESTSAITINRYRKGFAVYFAFDVAKTFWVLHHGKPIYKGSDEGPGNRWWIRTTQKTVITNNSDKVGYADEMLLLLQNIIALAKYPFIYQIPPKNHKIPVALFHWAGDDEGDSSGIQLKASNWMKKKNLPYHINVMEVVDRKIPLSQEDADKIIKNGHEISCHYNFTIYDGKAKKSDENNPLMATEHEVRKQSKNFRDKFGVKPLEQPTVLSGMGLLNRQNG